MLYSGDLFDVLPTLPEASVDACVTDPPYDLTSNKRGGFMGLKWDGSGVAFRVKTWRQVYRVLKPGAHLAAFGGPRTFHRMTSAIEDAGFEIRDCLSWLYGQGFPKSLNIGEGRGTALKPAWEPIVLARRPFKGSVTANVTAHGTGALNVDACRIGTGGQLQWSEPRDMGYHGGTDSSGTAQENALGRWPSNVLLDEEAAAMLDEQTESLIHCAGVARDGTEAIVAENYSASSYELPPNRNMRRLGDSGGASRFYYVAKPSREERDTGTERNVHPTVKPVELMRWLVRLATPIGGTVLDTFTGSGTTGMACAYELRPFIGIEREAEYVAIAERRIAACVPLFNERTFVGQMNCPRHGVDIKPDSVCEKCDREDPRYEMRYGLKDGRLYVRSELLDCTMFEKNPGEFTAISYGVSR